MVSVFTHDVHNTWSTSPQIFHDPIINPDLQNNGFVVSSKVPITIQSTPLEQKLRLRSRLGLHNILSSSLQRYKIPPKSFLDMIKK